MKLQVVAMAAAQAVRAAVTALIPITLVTLFGWASAGSGTGNTGDALRGSGMFWLASHHVLFSLNTANSDVVGRFWFLPIGLLLIPYLTLHGSGLRIARELRGAKLENHVIASLGFTFVYAVIVALVSGLVRTSAVVPHPVVAFIFGFLAALFFGVPRILEVNWPTEVRELWAIVRVAVGALMVVGLLLVLISLALNFSEVWSIVQVLRLGIISGFFVAVVCILYLPNVAIWAVAYASGIGFGFGDGTNIAPWVTDLGSVPAFPLFAAIPAQAPRFALVLPVLVLLVFAVVGFTRFHVLEYVEAIWPAARVAGAILALALVLAFFSGGPMVGGNLAAVGPSLWKFPLVLGLEAFVGIAVGSMGRVLLDRVRPTQRLRRV